MLSRRFGKITFSTITVFVIFKKFIDTKKEICYNFLVGSNATANGGADILLKSIYKYGRTA